MRPVQSSWGLVLSILIIPTLFLLVLGIGAGVNPEDKRTRGIKEE